MKYLLCLIGILFVCVSIFVLGGKGESVDNNYLRIHIIANSYDVEDQKIKYDVKDEIAKFLNAELKNLQNQGEASAKIEESLHQITEISNSILREKNVTYFAECSVMQEEIPTRAYDNVILKSGTYQTLVIKLGVAEGDNWWCVVFPNVCFAD